MRRTTLLLTAAFLLAGCAASATGQVCKWNCNDGLCITAEIVETPTPDESQPVLTLVVEVQSEHGIPDLGVSIYYSLPGWAANEGTPESTSMMREILWGGE